MSYDSRSYQPGSVDAFFITNEHEAREYEQNYGTRVFILPPQDDGWVIGDEDDVRTLIRDLEKVLKSRR